jgi:NTE family protein
VSEDAARASKLGSIGLCLSGGGLRAAFYALGSLRYLAEAGYLGSVVAISAVSGGSMAAAKVADRWETLGRSGFDVEAFLEEVDRPFRERVTEKSLRSRWLLAAARAPLRGDFRGRGQVLGDVVGELYETKRLVDLPDGVQTLFTATDLGCGRAFRMSREFIGIYDYRYAPTPAGLRLGTAVAASAAFPLAMSPIRFSTEGTGLKGAPQELALVDGGVYDNLAIEWFQGFETATRPPEAVRPEFLVVINASGPLDQGKPSRWTMGALWRERKIQYAQTLNTRVRWYVEKLTQSELQGLYLGITGDPRGYKLADNKTPVDEKYYDGALPSAFVKPLSHVRTDLDRFLPEEAELLSYHGYWSAHTRFGAIRPQGALERPSWRKYEGLSEAEGKRLLQVLARRRSYAVWR